MPLHYCSAFRPAGATKFMMTLKGSRKISSEIWTHRTVHDLQYTENQVLVCHRISFKSVSWTELKVVLALVSPHCHANAHMHTVWMQTKLTSARDEVLGVNTPWALMSFVVVLIRCWATPWFLKICFGYFPQEVKDWIRDITGVVPKAVFTRGSYHNKEVVATLR